MAKRNMFMVYKPNLLHLQFIFQNLDLCFKILDLQCLDYGILSICLPKFENTIEKFFKYYNATNVLYTFCILGLAAATGAMYLISLVGFICLFIFYTKVDYLQLVGSRKIFFKNLRGVTPYRTRPA